MRVTGKPAERLGESIEWKDKLDSGSEKERRRTGVQRERENEKQCEIMREDGWNHNKKPVIIYTLHPNLLKISI